MPLGNGQEEMETLYRSFGDGHSALLSVPVLNQGAPKEDIIITE